MKRTYTTKRQRQANPSTPIFYHTCKFTRKLFVSPIRRTTYSPLGLELKRRQDEEIKAAARNICKVYFYCCPITGRWFTTRIAGSKYSPESKAITHQSKLEYVRQHRQRPEVKQRERERRLKPERLAYLTVWERTYRRKPPR